MASRHFVHRFELHLLNFGQSLPLPGYQMIHLLVEVPDFKFGLEVDAIVALRPHAILHLLPLLAHHDDRRLQRRETGQDQIEQNVRIRIEPGPIGNRLIVENPDEDLTVSQSSFSSSAMSLIVACRQRWPT